MKSLEGRTSNESINLVRTPCHEEVAGFDLKSTAASAMDPNMYLYKQNSNGAIKGADYNGNI